MPTKKDEFETPDIDLPAEAEPYTPSDSLLNEKEGGDKTEEQFANQQIVIELIRVVRRLGYDRLSIYDMATFLQSKYTITRKQ